MAKKPNYSFLLVLNLHRAAEGSDPAPVTCDDGGKAQEAYAHILARLPIRSLVQMQKILELLGLFMVSW